MRTLLEVWQELDAKIRPRMTAFQGDLEIDKQFLLAKPEGTPFLHWARQMGTEIVMCAAPDEYPPEGERVPYLFGHADRHHILRGAVCIAECLLKNHEVLTAHYFDGERLHEITCERAVELARQYVARTEAAWRKPERMAA